MTKPSVPDEEGLRGAFTAQAARATVPTLDAHTLPGIRRRVTRRRIAWGAGAAAVIVAIAVAIPLVGLPGQHGIPAVPAVPAAPAVPKPPDGWRWESFRDVMVAVPDSWVYNYAPGRDWCAGDSFPGKPYVDLAHGDGATLDIGCFQAPSFIQQTHLSFTPTSSDPPWDPGISGWKQTSHTLGDVRITVVASTTDGDLVQKILETARTMTPDQHGCPATMPNAAPVPLAGVSGQPLAVCQYGDDGTLRASASLPDATAAWAAMLAAPGGGGPDSPATQCDPSSDTQSAFVLLAGAERTPIRMVVGHCRGNGLADAGADGGLRAITAPMCQAVLRPPVVLWSGSGATGEMCVGMPVETDTPTPVASDRSVSPTPTSPSDATEPALPDGFRWEETAIRWAEPPVTVRFAVPKDWTHGKAATSGFCMPMDNLDAPPPAPPKPYVDDRDYYSQGHAAPCKPVTPDRQRIHLSVVGPLWSDWPWNGDTPGWTQWSKEFSSPAGTITIVLTAPEDPPTAAGGIGPSLALWNAIIRTVQVVPERDAPAAPSATPAR